MRTIRTFLSDAQQQGQRLTADTGVFQHLVKVLRLSQGTEIQVFNGQGKRFRATLDQIGKREASIVLHELLTSTNESPLQTHMGLVMSKGDRFDYALQKATELGVTHITPLTSERCDLKLNAERAEKKMQHWHGVLVSACEQCYRDTLPVLNSIQPLPEWVNGQNTEVKLVLHTATQEPEWPEHTPAAVSFLIGPEGGLSDLEIKIAQQADFKAWQLGPRILRTETAPVVILSLLQQQWGDF